jgi:hypothetical protein
MRSKALRRGALGTTVLAIATAVFLLLPFGSSAQEPGQPCQQADPAEPLEMNTVESGKLFKTVAMEKEVFNCFDAAGGEVGAVVDLETFIEILEEPGPNFVRVVDKRVEVTRCVKNFREGTIKCEAKNLPLGVADQGIIANCRLPQGRSQPSDPVEMNTVASSNFPVVKTIKLDKEIFDCGQFVGDFYLFTEVIEARVRGLISDITGVVEKPKLAPVEKRFEAILCFKDPLKQDIERCVQIKI